MSLKKAGRCLCGAVSVHIEIERETFDACHCSMCRRWSGGPALTVNASQGVQFQGVEFINTFASSEWAERGFCKRCGTHLFYRTKSGDFCNLPLGLLEGADHFKFTTQIFVDNKPTAYEFANETEMLTEAEILAKYAT